MKRLTGSFALALLGLLLLVAPASAGWRWCAKDPIVALNGTAVQVLVALPEEYQSAVSGPIRVRVSVPEGVTTEVLFLDAGWNGHGEDVRFGTLENAVVAADGSFPVRIHASVPLDPKVLRAQGLPRGAAPLLLTVVTNGVYSVDGDAPAVVDGETTVVEGRSDGTAARVVVRGN